MLLRRGFVAVDDEGFRDHELRDHEERRCRVKRMIAQRQLLSQHGAFSP